MALGAPASSARSSARSLRFLRPSSPASRAKPLGRPLRSHPSPLRFFLAPKNALPRPAQPPSPGRAWSPLAVLSAPWPRARAAQRRLAAPSRYDIQSAAIRPDRLGSQGGCGRSRAQGGRLPSRDVDLFVRPALDFAKRKRSLEPRLVKLGPRRSAAPFERSALLERCEAPPPRQAGEAAPRRSAPPPA